MRKDFKTVEKSKMEKWTSVRAVYLLMSAVLFIGLIANSWAVVAFVICMLQVGVWTKFCPSKWLFEKLGFKKIRFMKKGLHRFKEIFLYSDSEPNEVLIGILHALILPIAMLEMMDPNNLLQIGASAVGFFQLYAVLYNGTLRIRKLAVQLATLVAIMTVVNYFLADMLHGSHFGWLLILIFAIWNLIRVTREQFEREM